MNTEAALSWFYQSQGKVTYSMTYRNGPNSYDCSSAVYYALMSGGFPNMRIGNTDSLFGDLEANGWTQVPIDGNGNAATQRGDVFIWGRRGASTGAAGHTGMFVDGDNIIHCSYGYNGIHVDNHDWLWNYNGQPPYTFYRYTGTPAPATGIQKGDTVKFTGAYTAEELQTVYNIPQIRTTALYKQNFDWGDNGIPVSAVIKVEGGYRVDTPLAVGNQYVIPGKFSVADVLADSGNNYALLNGVGGEQVWFVVDALTESADATPVPGYAQTPTPDPEEPEKPVEPVPEPTPTPEPEPKPEPPKEDTMAYSKDDIKELKIATQQVQNVVDDVASSKEVQDITKAIPQWLKVVVYIVGDLLIGIGLIVPSLVVALNAGLPVEQVTAISSVFATAGTFLLVMFGLYKSGKK